MILVYSSELLYVLIHSTIISSLVYCLPKDSIQQQIWSLTIMSNQFQRFVLIHSFRVHDEPTRQQNVFSNYSCSIRLIAEDKSVSKMGRFGIIRISLLLCIVVFVRSLSRWSLPDCVLCHFTILHRYNNYYSRNIIPYGTHSLMDINYS